MTNEEAIEFGKEQLEIFGEDSRMSEFIRLAIKALGMRDALKEQVIKGGIYYGADFTELIDNASTVSDRYDEGYAQGYVDGSTGADWSGDV